MRTINFCLVCCLLFCGSVRAQMSVCDSLNRLVNKYAGLGNWTEAMPLIKVALPICQAEALDTNVRDTRLAEAEVNYGALLMLTGQYAKADSMFRLGERLVRDRLGASSDDLSVVLNFRTQAAIMSGRERMR